MIVFQSDCQRENILSLYDLIKNFGHKAHDVVHEEVVNCLETEDGNLDVSKLVIAPSKYFFLSILTFGFYPFSVLYKLFQGNRINISSMTKFLKQIEEVAIKRNIKLKWNAATLSNMLVFFHGWFLFAVFASGGLSAHWSSKSPLVYHASPIIFLSTIPIGICVFFVLDTINHCAGVPNGETNMKLKFKEILAVICCASLAILLNKFGVSDMESGLFSILFDLFFGKHEL